MPCSPVTGIVTRAGSMETKEAGETVGAEFALEDFKGESLKFIVRQLIGGNHEVCSLTHNSGLRGVLGASADCASVAQGAAVALTASCAREAIPSPRPRMARIRAE